MAGRCDRISELFSNTNSYLKYNSRYTLPNGDTVWRYAPLVEAALDGRVAVLDGLHRVNPGTLSILQRYFYF